MRVFNVLMVSRGVSTITTRRRADFGTREPTSVLFLPPRSSQHALTTTRRRADFGTREPTSVLFLPPRISYIVPSLAPAGGYEPTSVLETLSPAIPQLPRGRRWGCVVSTRGIRADFGPRDSQSCYPPSWPHAPCRSPVLCVGRVLFATYH
jgi:hypothetical protein